MTFAKTDKENKIPEKLKPYPGTYKASAYFDDGGVFLGELLDGLKDIFPTCVCLIQVFKNRTIN